MSITSYNSIRVKEAKAEVKSGAGDVGQGEFDASDHRPSKMGGELFAAPPSDPILKRLDITAIGEAYIDLYKDAEKLKAYALNSKGTIWAPVAFERNIKIREGFLDSLVAVKGEVRDLDRIERSYSALIDSVGEVDTAAQRAVIARLHELNKQYNEGASPRLSFSIEHDADPNV
jgi:hypothetical protein